MTQKNRVCPECKSSCRTLMFQNGTTIGLEALYCVTCKVIYSFGVKAIEVKRDFFLSRSHKGEQTDLRKQKWKEKYYKRICLPKRQRQERLEKNKELLDFVEYYLKKHNIRTFTVKYLVNAFAVIHIKHISDYEYDLKRQYQTHVLGQYVRYWVKHGLLIKFTRHSHRLTNEFWELWEIFKKGELGIIL